MGDLHRIGIYRDGELMKTYRTGVPEVIKVLKSHAERAITHLRKQNPGRSYEVRTIFGNESKPRGWC
jgi:hypothetical protein